MSATEGVRLALFSAPEKNWEEEFHHPSNCFAIVVCRYVSTSIFNLRPLGCLKNTIQVFFGTSLPGTYPRGDGVRALPLGVVGPSGLMSAAGIQHLPRTENGI